MLDFINIYFQHPVAYIVYAEFETILISTESCQPIDGVSHRMERNEHIPCGYTYAIVDEYGKTVKPVKIHRGEDAVSLFLQNILQE